MADATDGDDPRERPWHPRFAESVVGHDAAMVQFRKAFASGRPHHAWAIQGPKGVGKATLAYAVAKEVLGGTTQAKAWVEARAHPDLYVLERQLNDAKPRKLKAEISVDDARGLGAFLARTASADWRVVIVDAADDLNPESGNAILKLVEEPPIKTLIFLISHAPGRMLRTLRSRCLRMALEPLRDDQVSHIIKRLPLDEQPPDEALANAVAGAAGSAGLALTLLGSMAASALADFTQLARPKLSQLIAIANRFAGRGSTPDDMALFQSLLLTHAAQTAREQGSVPLAEAHQALAEQARIAQGFNLDKRQAALEAMARLTHALKTA